MTDVKIIKLRSIFFFAILPLLFALAFNGCDKDVSVTPPDEPPPDGYLFIDSSPQGARIFLDGKDRIRNTPDSLYWLSTGSYEMTLKKQYFRDTTLMVEAVEGERESLFVDYLSNPKMLGKLECVSYPEGCNIYINQEETNFVTPHIFENVIPGKYEIKYSITNHKDKAKDFEVFSDQETRAWIALVDTTQWYEYTFENSHLVMDHLSCVFVDNSNRVWVGTAGGGFQIFDGRVWEHYLVSNSVLQDDTINCFYQDPDNPSLVWIGTNNGVAGFDGNNWMHFTKEKVNDSSTRNYVDYPITNFKVTSIRFSKGINMFFGTKDGFIRQYYDWRENKRHWSHYDFGIGNYSVSDLDFDIDGYLLIGTSNGLIRMNNYVAYSKYLELAGNSISSVSVKSNGDIWVGHNYNNERSGGLSKWMGNNWQNHYLGLEPVVKDFIIDSRNYFWIATTEGLMKTDNFIDIEIYNETNSGVNTNYVTGVAEDLNGNIWIATKGGGLIMKKNTE